MDIPQLYESVKNDRDHEARMCAEYCIAQAWDEAARRAKSYERLNKKLTAILEGRGAEYGIVDQTGASSSYRE